MNFVEYHSYKLSYACSQIELVRKLFAPDRQQSTKDLWGNSLCKLVKKNESSLFGETVSYLLVAIADAETLAEFDRLQAAFPHLVEVQAVKFEQHQAADAVGNW